MCTEKENRGKIKRDLLDDVFWDVRFHHQPHWTDQIEPLPQALHDVLCEVETQISNGDLDQYKIADTVSLRHI